MDIFSDDWNVGSDDFDESLGGLFSNDVSSLDKLLESCPADAPVLDLDEWSRGSRHPVPMIEAVSTLEPLFSVADSTLQPTEGLGMQRPYDINLDPTPDGLLQQTNADDYLCLALHVPPCMEVPVLFQSFLDAWTTTYSLSDEIKEQPVPQQGADLDPEDRPVSLLGLPHRNLESIDAHEMAPAYCAPSDNAPNRVSSDIKQWIQYDFSPGMGRRMVQTQEPMLAANGAKKRGRKGPLNEPKRRKVSDMRKTRACWNCRWLRKSCIGGTPCEQCDKSAKNRLSFNPCSRTKLETLSESFIQDVLFEGYDIDKVAKFLNNRIAEWTESPFSVDLTWGYGPTFACTVQRIVPRTADVMYASEWWYVQEKRVFRTAQVLAPPIAFLRFDPSGMRSSFDKYLDLIVDNHFSGFPLFSFGPATFRGGILQLIYGVYGDQDRPMAVRMALKLLLLVYIMNHVIRVDHKSDIIQNSHLLFPEYPKLPVPEVENAYHTPRLANVQIKMALSTMVGPMVGGVLNGLQYYIHRRKRTEWTITVSILVILALVMEELQVQIHLSVEAMETPHPGVFTKQQARQICNTMNYGGMEVILDLYTAAFGTWISEFGNGQLEENLENIDQADLSSLKFIGGLKFLSGKQDIDAARMYRIDEPGLRETVFPLKAADVSDFFDKVTGRLFLRLFKD